VAQACPVRGINANSASEVTGADQSDRGRAPRTFCGAA
jgi:hypothetical protein